MSVHEARPGDIYVDKDRKLWRVVSYCSDPTVMVEEVEPTSVMGGLRPGEIQPSDSLSARVHFIREKRSGSVYGLMWDGFIRILEAKLTSSDSQG